MSKTSTSTERYRRLLAETRELYRSSALQIEQEHPELAPERTDFVGLMEDLHRGLVLRVYLMICDADQLWTAAERDLAVELCEHLWGERLTGADLNRTVLKASKKTRTLEWPTLVGPFARLAPLRDRVAELETLVVRQSNLIARIDGTLTASEQAAIQRIASALADTLSPEAEGVTTTVSSLPSTETSTAAKPAAVPEPPTRSLNEVLADLDRLVGLKAVKEEIRSLSNYLKLQGRRGDAGLPTTEISLHLVFTGNPGTGKTTVARLFGEAMQAMGLLPSGRLIETDRSGLVAGYAGQTATKANEKIDEALGGVLFIDEAYGLVAAESDDPFGREAVQTLLKRAEDDRDQLAVVLAGYPKEMTDLLEANPGLASRFSRTIRFEDYSPLDLCRIFGRLMYQHHYKLTAAARLRVIQAITAMHGRRDRHFGNGRAVRNLFEKAILLMANRLASLPTLTDEQLVTLETDDIPWCETEPLPTANAEVRIVCPACDHARSDSARFLAARIKCPQCNERFANDWCDLAAQ